MVNACSIVCTGSLLSKIHSIASSPGGGFFSHTRTHQQRTLQQPKLQDTSAWPRRAGGSSVTGQKPTDNSAWPARRLSRAGIGSGIRVLAFRPRAKSLSPI
jgi:hypothetical protein